MLQLQAQWIRSYHSDVTDTRMIIFCTTILIFTEKKKKKSMKFWPSTKHRCFPTFREQDLHLCSSTVLQSHYFFTFINISQLQQFGNCTHCHIVMTVCISVKWWIRWWLANMHLRSICGYIFLMQRALHLHVVLGTKTLHFFPGNQCFLTEKSIQLWANVQKEAPCILIFLTRKLSTVSMP